MVEASSTSIRRGRSRQEARAGLLDGDGRRPAPRMNQSWYGQPVEEVDPMTFDDTFCVVAKKWRNRHYIHRFSSSKSLFLFSPTNPIRKLAVFITTHRFFDILIVFTIALNCVTLAMSTNKFEDGQPHQRREPPWDYYTDCIEYGFLVMYSLELALKVLAKGFLFNKFSYLRNFWNLLDFVVVTAGFVTTGIQIYNKISKVDQKELTVLSFLRTLRVLRVIKTISIVPGLKMMINALLSSARRLFEVAALMFACLLIFAIFAVELFQGKLKQKCVLDKGGAQDPDGLVNKAIASIPNKNDRDKLWTMWVSDWMNWAQRDFPNSEPTQCGNISSLYVRKCPEGYTCLSQIGENPDDGWTSFDSIYEALLSTFQLMTADYWERVYDVVMSTCGIWSLLFFIPVIFLGSYYLLNLLLAVVTLSYEDEAVKSQEEKGPVTAEDRLGLNRKKSTFSFDRISALNVCRLVQFKQRTKSELANLQELISRKDVDEEPEEEEEEKDKANMPRMDNATLHLMALRAGPLDEDLYQSTDRVDAKNRFSLASKKSSISTASEPYLDDDEEVKFQKEPRVNNIFKKKCCLCLQKSLGPVVNSVYFEWSITLCILLNTACLAAEHHNEPKLLEEILRYCNYVFIAIFAAECLLKLLALQLAYFQSGWNIFDMVVVLISFVDLIITESVKREGTWGLSVLRSMRLLRVLRLAQTWITMKVLLNIIFSSLGDLINLVVLLIIVIYIFAVMGIQVVGNAYSPGAFEATFNPASFPRWHWEHFGYAFMMVFRVLCGEWIEPLWDCLKAQNYASRINGDPVALCYFKCFAIYIPTLVIGNFIVFNLFLALLLNSFDTEQLNAQREKELEASGRAQNMKNLVGLMIQQGERESSVQEDAVDEEDNEEVPEKEPESSPEPMKSKKTLVVKATRAELVRRKWKKVVTRVMIEKRIEAAQLALDRISNRRVKRGMLMTKVFLKNPATKGKEAHVDVTPDTSEHSKELLEPGECCPAKAIKGKCCRICCRCCQKKHGIVRARKRYGHRLDRGPNVYERFRIWSVFIVSHPIFEWAILIFIFASSILLCFEDIHLETKPRVWKQTLCVLNYIFTGLFVVEMILKWFAIGLYRYFTTFWTLLDGFIVIVSLISLYFDTATGSCSGSSKHQSGDWISEQGDNLEGLKALRTLRALRPLRAISRWHGMKIVVNALIHAIPSIINVSLVCIIFWLIFAIMGVQFFKGGFYRCVDAEGDPIDHRVVPNKAVCCAKSGTNDYSWINTVSNYDNVGEAYLSLFQIATFEGWMELMAYSVDYVGVDKQPRMNYQIVYYLFYVVFIIFGAFFSLQLFISVIVDNFSALKKKYEGGVLEVLLTPQQRSYYIAMRNVGKRKPKRMIPKPKFKFLLFFYYFGMGKKLETFILVMISFNLFVEVFVTVDLSPWLANLLTAGSTFFTTFYLLEAIIKLLGLRHYYFAVPWNVYDLTICIASLMDTFLRCDFSVTMPLPPSMLRIFRVLRLGRILRTVPAAKGIRKLLFALTISIPALFNIGMLLGLVTFMYAILGMSLFGNAPRKWSIDDVFNFDTFVNSNLMLFRLMTVAGWNEVLDSLTVRSSVCGNYRHINCGSNNEKECPVRGLVIAYIVTYLLLTNQIMLNLFIAIILENYVEASNEEEVGILDEDLELFYIHWARYDPYATQFIHFDDLSDFLDSLEAPLRIKKPNMLAIVSFNLPIGRGNRIHCLDILYALIGYTLGTVEESPEFIRLQNRMERKFHKRFPNRGLLEIVSTSRRWKMELNAALTLQRAWRKYVAKKEARARARAQFSKAGLSKQNIRSSNSETSVTKNPSSTMTDRGGFGTMVVKNSKNKNKSAMDKSDKYSS